MPVGKSSLKVVYIRPGGQGIISTKYLEDPSSGLGGVCEHTHTHTYRRHSSIKIKIDLSLNVVLISLKANFYLIVTLKSRSRTF